MPHSRHNLYNLHIHIDAIQAVGGRLAGARPGQVAGVQATPDRPTHLGAGQAGSHRPEEEFVIVERVHNGTGGRQMGWAYPGGCNKTIKS
jgi:hypothetical protein